MTSPTIASRPEWMAARRRLLAKEKAFDRQRDALSAERRKLPVVALERDYAFEGPHGARTLGELFEGRRQLIVYHFMFDPAWDAGCPNCSFVTDHLVGALPHLAARDTSLVLVSRAPIAKIEAFRRRMGWDLPWFSSFASDFNRDFAVTLDDEQTQYNFAPAADQPAGYPRQGEREGLSVFLRDGERLFHAYSTYQRGLDAFLGTYSLLDHTPLGRQEEQGSMSWVRYRDEYPTGREGCASCAP